VARPRVLLADDHTMIAEALERLLEPGCEVVGTVRDGRALLAEAERLRPDVAVVDVSMPLLNGLDAARRLKKRVPGVRIIFLTVHEDPELAAEALALGASGYLLKGSAASELLKAVRAAMAGERYVTPLIAEQAERARRLAARRPSAQRLTPRQREVLQLLAEGRSMKEVATVLEITARTVAFHKYRLMKDLGLRTTAELVQYAVRSGLLRR